MSGSVVTQGDALHFADVLRSAGLSGAGIRIGVISDGGSDMADAVASGDLPAGIVSYGTCTKRDENRSECLSSWTCNEGTAIMEIIHDMAPSAELAIGAIGSSLDFIQRVDDLANTFEADVIIDDIGFFGEPYFEDGDVADAVAAVAGDVIFVSSAGNARDTHYEEDYRSADVTTLGATYNIHDFVSSNSIVDESQNITIDNNGYVVAILQWNDKFGASANDYDLLLTDNTDNTLLASSTLEQSGSHDPIEAVCYHNSTGSTQSRKILVNKQSGDDKRIEMFAFGRDINNQYNTQSGSVFGHAGVPAVISVAAANATNTAGTTFYSSRGPARIDFPEQQFRQKPDVTGIDGVSVTGTGGFPSTFFGTSAAAPHVAAIAGLLKEMEPGATPAVMKNLLMLSADDIQGSGYDNYSGAGIVNGSSARSYLLSNASDDSDADGVRDLEDAFPNDATESLDTDGDNVGNNQDTDDDGDGVVDSLDPAPLDNAVSTSVDNTSGQGEEGLVGTYLSRAYLITTSTSANVSEMHIVNTSDSPLSFTGTLYDGEGNQLGGTNTSLGSSETASNGRLILTALDLEQIFGVEPWSGPAMLNIRAASSFEVMVKLTSPSGLVSNTNCVKEGSVANVEGFDSTALSFIRFINTSENTLTNITGTLHAGNGDVVGTSDVTLLDQLVPNQSVWLNRNTISDLVSDTWNGTAQLDIAQQDGLKLLNLNFINSETFFNFSCSESVTADDIETSCSDPRPDACTQQIDYVCAKRDDGNSGSEWASYSNACIACSNSLVSTHKPGQCENRF